MILGTLNEHIDRHLGGDDPAAWDLIGLREAYKGILTNANDFEYSAEELKKLNKQDIEEEFTNRALEKYKEKEEQIGADRFREIERAILLRNVDSAWMDHIDIMEDLKDTIRLQSYAQRDPVTEYRIQGSEIFESMIADIRENTSRMILSVTIKTPEIKRVQIAKPLQEGFEGDTKKAAKKVTVTKKAENKVGRNDLCPCGSGKKYKKCCGAPANED